jgi:hypothetical protein
MTGCNIALPYDPSTGRKTLTITGPFDTITCAIPLDCGLDVMVSCLNQAALKLQAIAADTAEEKPWNEEKDHD